jgi:hypothetical protein
MPHGLHGCRGDGDDADGCDGDDDVAQQVVDLDGELGFTGLRPVTSPWPSTVAILESATVYFALYLSPSMVEPFSSYAVV